MPGPGLSNYRGHAGPELIPIRADAISLFPVIISRSHVCAFSPTLRVLEKNAQSNRDAKTLCANLRKFAQAYKTSHLRKPKFAHVCAATTTRTKFDAKPDAKPHAPRKNFCNRFIHYVVTYAVTHSNGQNVTDNARHGRLGLL